MTSIAVLGATGNLGRHVARQALDQGWALSVAVRHRGRLVSDIASRARITDLDLSQVPDDCLQVMAGLLARHPQVGKIGLTLSTEGIPKDSPYFDHVQQYARVLPTLPVQADGLVPMPVDTTFAIHDKRSLSSYKICGMRMPAPSQGCCESASQSSARLTADTTRSSPSRMPPDSVRNTTL